MHMLLVFSKEQNLITTRKIDKWINIIKIYVHTGVFVSMFKSSLHHFTDINMYIINQNLGIMH
jgi:hypothetical protein